jgi:hypothetical protein
MTCERTFQPKTDSEASISLGTREDPRCRTSAADCEHPIITTSKDWEAPDLVGRRMQSVDYLDHGPQPSENPG